MPHRSTGCYRCRKRKIRCDGLRPSCQRCATHRVPCPGYQIATPGDVEFRDESKLAAERSFNGDKGHMRKPTSAYGSTRTPSRASRQSSVASTPRSSNGTRTQDTPLMDLKSPDANRVQLYNTFLDIFIPKNFLSEERGATIDLAHLGFVRQLGSHGSSHPALSKSMDALSLVSTGSLYGDQRLLRQALEEYTRGLKKLAHALAKPESLYDDNILAAILVLKICEFYDEIRSVGDGFATHQNGLLQVLAARGPETYNTEFSSLLLANAKTSSITYSMIQRRKDFYDSSVWSASNTEVLGLQHDPGHRLPAILERHDSIQLSSAPAIEDVDGLLSECAKLEDDMKEYLRGIIEPSLTQYGDAFIEEDVGLFSPFGKLVIDRTIKNAYRFPSFSSAFAYSSYWLRMHFLRTTVRSLHAQRCGLAGSGMSLEVDVLPVSEVELEGYVMNLCCCVPYFMDPANSTIGQICCFFPLVLAANYFNQIGDQARLGWVYHVRSRVFNRGVTIPAIQGAEIPLSTHEHAVQLST